MKILKTLKEAVKVLLELRKTLDLHTNEKYGYGQKDFKGKLKIK